jgi:hypothetical protein
MLRSEKLRHRKEITLQLSVIVSAFHFFVNLTMFSLLHSLYSTERDMDCE